MRRCNESCISVGCNGCSHHFTANGCGQSIVDVLDLKNFAEFDEVMFDTKFLGAKNDEFIFNDVQDDAILHLSVLQQKTDFGPAFLAFDKVF